MIDVIFAGYPGKPTDFLKGCGMLLVAININFIGQFEK